MKSNLFITVALICEVFWGMKNLNLFIGQLLQFIANNHLLNRTEVERKAMYFQRIAMQHMGVNITLNHNFYLKTIVYTLFYL